MAEAERPKNEAERLNALYSYDLIDHNVGPVFDNIIRIAADICDVEISVIALIGDDRQYFLARNNMKPKETPRAIAFCAHAILEPHTTFEIENATKDPRFQDNPLVTGEIGVRFYAAHPLTTDDGFALGGLCLIGKKPKKLNELQRSTLQRLADIIMTLFDDRKREMALISRRKKTEEALIQNEDRLRAILDNMPSFINLKDKDGHYELINQKHVEIFGFDQQDVRGKVISEFLPKVQAKEASAQEREVLDTKTPVTIERKITSNQKPHEFLVTKFPIFDESGDIVRIGTIGTDVTELKEVQDALLTANAAAEASNRSKSEFLATMSHELRTPLTSIKGGLGLLSALASDDLNSEGKNLLEIAKRNSDAMLRLVNELLDYEKILSGTTVIETIAHDLSSLTAKVVMDNQAFANAQGVSFDYVEPTEPMFAKVNEHRFEQVLRNLLSNAAKFSNRDSTVKISISKNAGTVSVKVKDGGPGIPEEFRNSIFDQFYQIDSSSTRANPGTGLGLPISKALTEGMAGTLDFETELGIGSTFCISFVETSD